jgi:hypothetical protein
MNKGVGAHREVISNYSKRKWRIEGKSWALHPDWKPEKRNSKADYAVITLEKPVEDGCFWGNANCGGGTQLGTLPDSVAGKLIGGRIVTAGYPSSKDKEMWCFTGKASTGSSENDSHLTSSSLIRQWVQRTSVLYVSTNAEKGQSGSPIWIADDGNRYLAGILVEAGEKFNTAVSINGDVLRQIRKWTGQVEKETEEFEFETETAEFSDPELVRETFEALPQRESAYEEEEVPRLPAGVPKFEHFFQPMKPNAAGTSWQPDGAERLLEVINPAFVDANDELVTGPLQGPLTDLLTGSEDFSRYLTKESVRSRTPQAGDKIQIALVDLTRKKLTKPEFAGWGLLAITKKRRNLDVPRPSS